jgi:hypothetical protein|tara:strand:- start:3050 stop:4708 length:1659 start_codon:yes stop_codon:yes gene_type:complete
MAEEITTISNALSTIANGLTEQEKYDVGSFREFVQNIWCYGYDNPEYFQAWHVSVITEDVEECMELGLNYCAILPRFHFKSTILGHAFSVWRLLTAPRDCSVLYLSYADHMARYHIAEINKTVSRNPMMAGMLENRNPKADYSARFYRNSQPMEITHGGLFSFKRGMHVNGALIADDIMRDPENPLNISQLTKIEDHFMTESLFIPLKGVPVIVLGTPMLPGDLLHKLQEDERFKTRVLPALDPAPNRRVLMPELYSEEWLLQQQKARPKSFASEFMLTPHFSTEAYFDDDDITKCEDPSLINYPSAKEYKGSQYGDLLFGGFDVGKKRHPSHLVIFKKSGERVEQVHSSFLDGWSYSDQIVFLNEIADNYGLAMGYIDNTRGELEDRGLDARWHSMTFTRKSKNTMAQVFEQFVHSGNLKLLEDERQKQQILSVSNELKAPETPLGHGDAFFSISMALQAAHDTAYKYTNVGNVADWLDAVAPGETPESRAKADDELSMVEYTKEKLLKMEPTPTGRSTMQSPNPDCKEAVCNEAFWVPKNKLCLYCGVRG